MTTVLEALQRAANRIGIPAPSSLSSNTKLLALLYETNEDLRATRAFRQQLQSWSITLTASRANYPMPPDFYAAKLGTHYDQTNSWPMAQQSDPHWNYQLYGIGSSPSRKEYRVFGPDGAGSAATEGGQIQISPTPDAADVISFDYVMASTLIPKYWAISETVTAGHYRSANGRIYSTAAGGITGSAVTSMPTGVGAQTADNTISDWTWVSAPYVTAIQTTDLLVFPDEVVILGMIWRYFERRREPFEVMKKLYDDSKAAAISQMEGPTVVRGDGTRRHGRSYVQPGSWSFP